MLIIVYLRFSLDCKTVGFFLKISKEIGKAWRKSLTPRAPCSRPFFLTSRAYLNTHAKIRTVLQSTSHLASISELGNY